METERERIFREIYEDNIGRLYQYVLRRIGDVNYTRIPFRKLPSLCCFI